MDPFGTILRIKPPFGVRSVEVLKSLQFALFLLSNDKEDTPLPLSTGKVYRACKGGNLANPGDTVEKQQTGALPELLMKSRTAHCALVVEALLMEGTLHPLRSLNRCSGGV